jgi:hypothetical protein
MGGAGQQQEGPPPGYGPGGYGPPPPWAPSPWTPPPWAPPPRRRRSRWLTVGLPIAGVVLLGGLVAVVVFAVKGFTGALQPASQAADAYATALVEQRWDDAHGMLCDRSAAEFTAEDLAVLFRDPPMTGFSTEGVNVNWTNGLTTGEVSMTFETEDGERTRTVLALVEEEGTWRPCP